MVQETTASTVVALPDHSGVARLRTLITEFLQDLERIGRSAHTIRAYRSDLNGFADHYDGAPEQLTADDLRAYLTTQSAGAQATRARREAALSSLLGWAYRNDKITANPMDKIERTRLGDPQVRGLPASAIEKIFAAIPKAKVRDRLLFRLIYLTGMRVSEALTVDVDDLDLTLDDEHVTVLGKGGRRRTILLDDRVFVTELRRYLKHAGYTHGPLFRAQKNGTGRPLRYQSVQELWATYCAKAKVTATMHQLRHSHATELVNDGVSLETIRRRLGHKNLQTTLRYAEQTDATADAEIRAWRRRRRTR